MKVSLEIGARRLTYIEAADFVFLRRSSQALVLNSNAIEQVRRSEAALKAVLTDSKIPIYGVTTGFGDSCLHSIDSVQAEALQKNLVNYLTCGVGATLPKDAARATFFIRLTSMMRGLSGVSVELVERMKLFLEKDLIPVIPRQGSLGASGDLVPLAYIAQALQGRGEILNGNRTLSASQVYESYDLKPYKLKAKEGLALVNGTSTMAGLALVNLEKARVLLDLTCVSSAWACYALKGWEDSFSPLVNERAKTSTGQTLIAASIRKLFREDGYRHQYFDGAERSSEMLVQDRYSLRCTPQVLGPIVETLDLIESWVEEEINSVSDNPLVDSEGRMSTGGNFYGGYLSHGMDYMKICLGHMADLLDRQLMTLMDSRSNRGLYPNLVNWDGLSESERYLHHGLKGLHQAVSAITSEIMAKTMPNGMFSRSSESHNQDKVSLGMSAATQCSDVIDDLFSIQSMYLLCLAQALDLRKIKLTGVLSVEIYETIREICPLVTTDRPLDAAINALKVKLIERTSRESTERLVRRAE